MYSNTKTVVQNVNNQLQVLNDVLLSEVKNGLRVTWRLLDHKGQITLSKNEKIGWDTVNQYSEETARVVLPKMLIGGDWLDQNRSIAHPSPIVDDVKELVGGTATIFQRMNAQGDMLRVCTNVETKEKTRAIGTYIPAVNPDSTKNPVVKAMLEGQAYHGLAYVVDAWYLTSYEPIFDENSSVIGAIYFGVRQEKSEALRKGIRKTVVGKKGYVYVLDKNGRYIISKDGKQDGENVLSEIDNDGNLYIEDIIGKALELKPGEVGFGRYNLTEPGQATSKARVDGISYFEPWGWVVVAGAYEDDFKETQSQMHTAISKMVSLGTIIGVVVTILIILIALYLSGKISKPIVELTKVANQISEGSLDQSIDINTGGEIGQLATAFKRMQWSVIKLMERAQRQKK
jgi:methyl-accepting chemotaxis protein